MEPKEKQKKPKKPVQKISVYNRKASFEYELLDKFDAGIKLVGSEIKSIRLGNVNISDAYCYVKNGQVVIRNMHISELKNSVAPHDPLRERVLLLTKKEIRKIETLLKNQGLTLVPKHLYSAKGLVKLEVAIARGKKLYDKRESIKQKDLERASKRVNND